MFLCSQRICFIKASSILNDIAKTPEFNALFLKKVTRKRKEQATNMFNKTTNILFKLKALKGKRNFELEMYVLVCM